MSSCPAVKQCNYYLTSCVLLLSPNDVSFSEDNLQGATQVNFSFFPLKSVIVIPINLGPFVEKYHLYFFRIIKNLLIVNGLPVII